MCSNQYLKALRSPQCNGAIFYFVWASAHSLLCSSQLNGDDLVKLLCVQSHHNDNDTSIARPQLRQLIKIKQKTFLEFVYSDAMWLMTSVREWIEDDASKSHWIITTNMLRILITRFRSLREDSIFFTIQKVLLTREQLNRKSVALSAR